jgi:arylsulfatase A-like enzyme
VTEVVPGYVTNVITDDALDYIDAHAEDENPFYLSVHYTAPHAPWIGHPQDIVYSYDDCAFVTCPQEPLHPWAKVPEDDADLPARSAKGLSNNLGQRESLKGYFAAVSAMDLDVGRILDKLEEKVCANIRLLCLLLTTGIRAGSMGFGVKAMELTR